MKRVLMASLLVLVVSAMAVGAQPYDPPKNDLYKSVDLPGGTILTGYFSESWVPPGFGHGNIGNTVVSRIFETVKFSV